VSRVLEASRGYPDISPTIGGASLRPSAMRHQGSGGIPVAVQACAPAPGATGEHVGMMEQPVEQRSDGGGVTEELAPVARQPLGLNEILDAGGAHLRDG